MLTLIMKKLRGRCLALVTAIALVAGCVVAASAPPASAQAAKTAQVSRTAQVAAPAVHAALAIPGGSEQLCLANSNGNCVGVPIDEIFHGVLAAADTVAAWVAIWLTWRSKGTADGGQQGEEQDTGAAGDGDPDAGLCLADTGGDAFMTACGANGTVWIAIPHNDGVWLYSRYTVNNHNPEVLTANTANPGAPLYVTLSDSSPGGPWQTWNWYSTSHT